jgi:hypothetical protein
MRSSEEVSLLHKNMLDYKQRMSSCNGGLVLPNYTAQLSGTERTSIKLATTVYNANLIAWNRNIANGTNKGQAPRFKNAQDYIAYKKARALVNANPPVVNGAPVRPPPTSLLLNPACLPDCSGNTGCFSGPF